MYLIANLLLVVCSAVECAVRHAKLKQKSEENKTVTFRGSWQLEPGGLVGNGVEDVVHRFAALFSNVTLPEDIKAARRLDRIDDQIAVALVSGLVLTTLTVCCFLGILNAEDPDSSPPSRSKGWPLTPKLVVPEGKVFLFRIPTVISRGRQKRGFDVLDCHGEAVCSVSIDELVDEQQPAIRLETKVEEKLLAYILTEQLEEDKLRICKPDGTVFAIISRKQDHFVVCTEKEILLTCYGDFLNHHIRLVDSNHRKAAITQPDRDGYTGSVLSQEDVGLVLCTLLAIDKLVQPVQPQSARNWERYLEAELDSADTESQKDPFFASGTLAKAFSR